MVVKTQATLSQSIFLNLRHKFRAFVGGYGSGKSYVGSMALCSHSWKYPKVNSGYFAPTYSQIRDIFFPNYNKSSSCDIKKSTCSFSMVNGGVKLNILLSTPQGSTINPRCNNDLQSEFTKCFSE